MPIRPVAEVSPEENVDNRVGKVQPGMQLVLGLLGSVKIIEVLA